MGKPWRPTELWTPGPPGGPLDEYRCRGMDSGDQCRCKAALNAARYCRKHHAQDPDYHPEVPFQSASVASEWGRTKGRKIVRRHFKLLPGHIVHHENCNEKDNRLENLRVFASIADHNRYHAGFPVEPLWDGSSPRAQEVAKIIASGRRSPGREPCPRVCPQGHRGSLSQIAARGIADKKTPRSCRSSPHQATHRRHAGLARLGDRKFPMRNSRGGRATYNDTGTIRNDH